MNQILTASLVIATLALAGCAQPDSRAAPSAPPLIAPFPAEALKAIRAAGAGLDSAVQVEPLRDPAIRGFLRAAHAAEAAGDVSGALAQANQALRLAPDAPDILQYQAELEVARSDWVEAERLAIRSFTLGPKVGSLCARNWQTVIEARTAMNDAATVAHARQRLGECRVAPRLRM